MKYSTAPAFRQALEARLRSDIARHEIPRFRKMIAFERLMARLDDQWILKGGYALQLRTSKARTTQDVDLLVQNLWPDQISASLLEQAHRDIGDYFEFYVERINPEVDVRATLRFQVTARLAGRIFERFHVDVGIDDPIIGSVEFLSPPQHLLFADIEASPIPCYPVAQHVAEKVHALIRPRPIESSRVKDLIDLLIFAELDTHIESEHLFLAIQAVFDAYQDRLIKMENIPAAWKSKYQQMTRNIGFTFLNFEEAVKAAQQFINPVLDGIGKKIWNPKNWKWE